MRDLKIIRKSITANTAEKFEFDVEGFEFLVKNFNEFDIYVSFKNTTDTSKMIKIPAKCAQVCIRNKPASPLSVGNSSDEVYIYATESGEVEVQCLKF